MNVTATQFPQVYKNLGIDPQNRGCIMLDVEPIKVSHVIPTDDLWSDDLDDLSKPLPMVPESESEPHVTLLYGLMHSGPEMKAAVDGVLEGWIMPINVTIDEVGFFYGNPAKPNVAIIAKVKVSDSLVEGNQRLKMLPHINTYPEYTPHITLAYVKDTADWQQYVDKLHEKLARQTVGVKGLNYGH